MNTSVITKRAILIAIVALAAASGASAEKQKTKSNNTNERPAAEAAAPIKGASGAGNGLGSECANGKHFAKVKLNGVRERSASGHPAGESPAPCASNADGAPVRTERRGGKLTRADARQSVAVSSDNAGWTKGGGASVGRKATGTQPPASAAKHAITTKGTGANRVAATPDHAINSKGSGGNRATASPDHAINTKGTGTAGRSTPTPTPTPKESPHVVPTKP